MPNVCLKKTILLRPSKRISNFHHPIASKRERRKWSSCWNARHTGWCGTWYTSNLPTSQLLRSHRITPKCRQIDESLIGSLEGMLSKCSIAYQNQEILVNYFDSKCDGYKCILFLSLLKSRCMTVIRTNLRIRWYTVLNQVLILLEV